MKKLILILILFCSPLLADEFEGLFGFKIGEELYGFTFDRDMNDPTSIGLNLDYIMENHIKSLKTKDEKIKKLEQFRRTFSSYNQKFEYWVLPKIPNEMFSKFRITISPLSKRIVYILAHGKMIETRCKQNRINIFEFIINKYSSTYKPNSSWLLNTETRENIYLHKIEKTYQESEDLDSNEIITTDLQTTSYPNDIVEISISCANEMIYISAIDDEYYSSIRREESAMINERISLEIKKITKEDLDTSGL